MQMKIIKQSKSKITEILHLIVPKQSDNLDLKVIIIMVTIRTITTVIIIESIIKETITTIIQIIRIEEVHLNLLDFALELVLAHDHVQIHDPAVVIVHVLLQNLQAPQVLLAYQHQLAIQIFE